MLYSMQSGAAFGPFLPSVSCVILAGVYVFTLLAAPSNKPDHNMEVVFNYVIHVSNANPEQVPFVEKTPNWNESYKVNIVDGHIEQDQEKVLRVNVPDANGVIYKTSDCQQTHLDKV